MEASIKSQVNNVFLRSNFRKEDARFISELLASIDQKQEISIMENKEYFLNKDDKVELIEKIGEVKSDLTYKIGEVKSELTDRIGEVKSDLTYKIGEVKSDLTYKIGEVKSELTDRIGEVRADLTKSIYIVGFVQFVAIIASVLAIVNFMIK